VTTGPMYFQVLLSRPLGRDKVNLALGCRTHRVIE
jgi:hypothetical protein